MFQMTSILIAYLLLGPKKGQIFEKKSLKIFFSETVYFMKLILCIHVPGISCFLFQSDKNSGCYGNFQLP